MRDLPHILNWRRITDRITTSGQPSEEQLAEISTLGVTHIINLGPHHNKGALEDEAATVTALGMEYVYIPVEFDNPTDEDFSRFCDAVERLDQTPIHEFAKEFGLRVRPDLDIFSEAFAPTNAGIAEIVIPPDSKLIGKSPRDLLLRMAATRN